MGLVLSSCAATPGTPRAPSATPPAIDVPRTVITPERATSVPELYAHAVDLAKAGEHARAAVEFDRVAELDPDGDLADDAWFRAGEEHDLAGALELAAGRYEQLARRYPGSPLARKALVRAVRVLTHLERWERAGELAQRALASEASLETYDRVLVYGASALHRLALNDEQAAATFIERGRSVIESAQLDAAGRVPRELATLYYALGELRRRRADRIVFVPMPANFPVVLEQRCQLLLDAQSAYSDTMRAYDAHWSAMAGYRVGELYQRLHEDVMQITAPASADTEDKRKLFEGAMRLRYSILLEKASAMLEHTLAMSTRTGERSSWVERAVQAKSRIDAAMAREKAALDALPYSRATLEAALEDLKRRAEAKQKALADPKNPRK